MFERFSSMILRSDFVPHGFCLKWSPELLLAYVISDGLIFLAYFSIPCALIYFSRKRPNSGLNPLLWLFAAFILACGLTHFMDVVTLWRPYYTLDAGIKVVTALISVAAVLYLWPRIPYLLETPAPEELLQFNRQLSAEIENRKTAEALLRSSEERWKFALESGGDGVWDWDLSSGKVYMSPRCMQILGFGEIERGNDYRDWENTVHPDDREHMLQELQAHLRGQSERFSNEHRVLSNEQEWRWILTHGMVVSRDADGKALRMIGTQTDITERKLMHWQQISKFIDGSPEAMLLVAQNGTIQLANAMAERIFAYPHAGMLGLNVDSLLPASARSDHAALRQQFMVENRARPMSAARSLSALRADGSEFPVEISLTPIDIDNQRSVIVSLLDVTERNRLEREMRLMAMIHQAIGEAVMVADSNNRIVAINEAFTRLTGYSEQEAIGQSTDLLKSGKHGPDFYQAMWHALSQTGHWQGEIWNRRKNGEIYHEWLVINSIFGSQGEVERRVAMFSEITERKQVEQTIWRQANFDPLTDLANRRMFHERLRQEIKKAHRERNSLAVMLLDLDHFKEVNDTLGHAMGDSLLREAARRIQQCVREVDTVARLGGDEFTVILCGLDEHKDVTRVADSILEQLVKPFHLDGEVAYISVSIGITLYPGDADNAEQLVKNADQAMYFAKQQGRNCFSFFTQEMEQSAQNRLRLANDLRQALANQEFRVHYQPIVDFSDGSIHKAEALIRWQHPGRGFVSPAEFIPIAEETGLIVDIGDWVFRVAVQQVAKWQKMFHSNFAISVNKSPIQINRKRQRGEDWLLHLAELGIAGESIVIEITESLLLDVDGEVSERLYGYRDAGIQVAIDDFGTGYSSLSYLKKFDIDYLKIDQSFVRNLATDSNELALCEAIIVMAHKLGMKVIAEGIESEQQMKLLKDAGCDFGQGYYFAAPMTAVVFEASMKQANAFSGEMG